MLTTGQDSLTGGAGNDVFKAYVFDNQNTLQSGDSIDGGAGTDTLLADLGSSNKFAITPETKSVEIVKFRVQANDPTTDGSENNTGHTGATIDAERMQGVKEFWSSNSRADLKVEDVRINSNQVTIGMENTDAGKVDMRVYFDNQNLVPNGKSGAQLSLELIDTRGAQKGQPLLDNPSNGFNFTMDGKSVTVKSKAFDDAQTYEELATAINDALKAAGIKGVTAEVGPSFTAKDTVSGTNVQGNTIILTNSGSEILGPGNWIADGGVPPSSGLHTNMGTGAPGCTLIETDVKLDNVGRVNWDMVECGDRTVWGSGAGVLEIGAMGNRGGVQQFNVEVDRGSWLAGMSSTNMALEKVVLTNGAKNGNLYLGSAIEAGFDANTAFAKAPTFMKNDGLVNVRELDGSAFKGQLNIGAAIDDKLYERDLDRTSGSSSSNTDTGAYKGDDLAFQYNLGKGNDLLNLSLSQKVAGDQDFSLNVNGGAGNDQVLFKFVDAAATGNAAQKALNNVTLNGGEGDDTIITQGAGDAIINGGAGNDAVYVTNDSDKAAWEFNLNLRNSTSTALVAANFDADTATAPVTITFLGLELKVDVPVTVATGGATATYTIADLNQAIKSGINSDPVFSKLLVAHDGGGDAFALHISSLFSGALDAADFGVQVGNTGTAVNVVFAQTTGTVTSAGADSASESDSVIAGGAGNDVIVLGSRAHSNDTVVIDAANNGIDTIIGFEAGAGGGADVIQLAKGAIGVYETMTITNGKVAAISGDLSVPGSTANVVNGVFYGVIYDTVNDTAMLYQGNAGADGIANAGDSVQLVGVLTGIANGALAVGNFAFA